MTTEPREFWIVRCVYRYAHNKRTISEDEGSFTLRLRESEARDIYDERRLNKDRYRRCEILHVREVRDE